MNTTHNLMPIVAAFITGILGPILVKIIVEWFEKKKDPIKEALAFADKVSDKLEELKDDFNADRVYILQFHNGGYYYPTGKSIQKFSMMYEIVSDSKFSGQQSFQNIPVNLFSKSLKELVHEDVICIPDYKDETVATFGLKYLAQENGIASTYLGSIKNIDGRFVGVLGVDFHSKMELTEEEITHLQVVASMIGGELSKYLKR